MDEESGQIVGGAVLLLIGCFLLFTLKSCMIESQTLDNEKFRIDRECPKEKTK